MTNKQESAAPIAVIAFSENASPLEPLWPSTHRALLPIAGKPLIVHLIEQLSDAGVRHVRIAGSIQQFPVRNRIGCGREWGITVRYSDLHGDDLRAECLATEGECLYLIGDHLLDVNFKAIGNRSFRTDVAADLTDGKAGLWTLAGGQLQGRSLGLATGEPAYENPLLSVSDYHYVNLRAVRGLLPRLNLPGSAIHRSAVADWKTNIAVTASIGTDVFIGKHCRVGQLARLKQDCILANGVVVENGAQLQNVSVLPNCFVGRKLALRDAVLGATGIMDLEGRYWPINNRQFLDVTRDNREPVTGLPSRRLAGLLEEWWAPGDSNPGPRD